MSRMNRRQALTVLGTASLGVLAPGKSVADVPTSFNFLFITDCHIQPELNAAAGTDAAFSKARSIAADFTIQGGDHVFDAGAVSKQRALDLFDLYRKTEQDLGMRVYHTIGNHDCLGILGTNISKADPQYGKLVYQERFGKTYFSFNHKHCHFVVLDSIGIVPNGFRA